MPSNKIVKEFQLYFGNSVEHGQTIFLEHCASSEHGNVRIFL